MRRSRPSLLFALALAALTALAACVYAPGLHGSFLFDDYANLPALGATGPINNGPAFWRYITSGHADPTGRPLTLLSFLADAHDWPADPWPFKRSNLIIHLLNGVLLALLLRRLGRALCHPSRDSSNSGTSHPHPSPLPPAGEGVQSRAPQVNPSLPSTRESARSETPRVNPPLPLAGESARSETPRVNPPLPLAGEGWGEGGGHLRIELAALLGAAFWLLHPLFVSTTLYIVQREAMLPATFTLLGLLLWLHGRTRLLQGHTTSGVVWVILGLGGCTALGVLSKANGILLPALALVVEYTVMRRESAAPGVHPAAFASHPIPNAPYSIPTAPSSIVIPAASPPIVIPAASPPIVIPDAAKPRSGIHLDPAAAPQAQQNPAYAGMTNEKAAAASSAPRKSSRIYHWAMAVLAWAPTAMVALYLAHAGWRGLVHGISSVRPWTLGQRLLTEPRVLLDYLGLLWAPRPFTPGLFNDHIHASTSLLSPASTLPALLAVMGLIIGAWLLRRRWPAVALAVLFYFVGQALESSTVALELFFEHRNYLPALLMFWPLALWLCGVPQGRKKASHRTGIKRDVASARAILAALLILGLGTMAWARADLWGNTEDQALLWAQLNPHSPRAQAYAAQTQMNAGHPRAAIARLQPALAAAPEEVQLALNLFAAQCQAGHVNPSVLRASETALHTTRDPGSLLTSWFERAIAQTRNPPCPQLTLTTLDHLLQAARDNTRLMARAGRRQDIAYLQGRVALARGDGDAALADFNHALDQQVRMSAALNQAAALGAAGFPSQGLAHLDYYQAQRTHEYRPGFGMPRLHAWVLAHQHYWQHELAHLRATLRKDAAQPHEK